MSNRTACAGNKPWRTPSPNPLIAAWAKNSSPQAKALWPELFPPSARERRAAKLAALATKEPAQ